jgi:glyoxylase-like metal-dependent hydrolase (beta-lactamase superfamily II)
MSGGPAFEVIAVRYATRMATKSAVYYEFKAYGLPDEPLQMDYFFYVLRDGEQTIVVDTGFTPDVGAARGRTTVTPPLEALARLGVVPSAVSLLVLSHLHYDHTGHIGAFTNAEIVVQRRELDFWTGPVADHVHFAAHREPADLAALLAARDDGRVQLQEGSGTIVPGVDAVLVGGHCPGQQVFVVQGERGRVLLASDAIHYYEELDRKWPFILFSDLEEMVVAYDTVAALAAEPDTVLVPGHDPEVMDRFERLPDGVGVRVA